MWVSNQRRSEYQLSVCQVKVAMNQLDFAKVARNELDFAKNELDFSKN